MSDLALRAENITGGYDRTVVVKDVSIELKSGRAVALLGRNGMGKTTLLRTIAGRIDAFKGRVLIDGADMTHASPSRRCRAGLAFVPQERQIFRDLTVTENMRIADLGGGWSLARCFQMFPHLERRKNNMSGQLSGGEQQMLAIARAMMGGPRYLLLDEPFEGLAPVIVNDLIAVLKQLRKETGVAMLMVEQHARLALQMADEAILLERGSVRLQGASTELLTNWIEVERLLTLESAPARDAGLRERPADQA